MNKRQIIKEFKRTIREIGLKYTPQREEVFKAILQKRGHFEIEDIVELVKKKGLKASRATVYRTLEILKELGYIQEVIKFRNKTIYETNLKEHHDHFVCKKCGKIIEFHSAEIEKLQDKICKEFDFKPDYHRLEIFGICKKCQGKK